MTKPPLGGRPIATALLALPAATSDAWVPGGVLFDLDRLLVALAASLLVTLALARVFQAAQRSRGRTQRR